MRVRTYARTYVSRFARAYVSRPIPILVGRQLKYPDIYSIDPNVAARQNRSIYIYKCPYTKLDGPISTVVDWNYFGYLVAKQNRSRQLPTHMSSRCEYPSKAVATLNLDDPSNAILDLNYSYYLVSAAS